MARVPSVTVSMLVLATACSGAAAPPSFECEPENRQPPEHPDAGWDVNASRRDDCVYGPGATTEQSTPGAPSIPRDKLQHVIIILRENRSFDHILGAYTPPPEHPFVDPLPPDAEVTNPDPAGTPRGVAVPRFHERHYCTASPAHEWHHVHLQFNNGRLDGFVAASNRDDPDNDGGCVAMGYYDEEDLPFYYWLARNFAISDRMFSPLLGPTMPNVMFYFLATSCGTTENVESVGTALFSQVTERCGEDPLTIFDLLDRGGVSYDAYTDADYWISSAAGLGGLFPLSVRTIDEFKEDVARGDLAEVVFVEPNNGHLTSGQNDEHPPSNIQDGQHFVYDVVTTIMAQPSIWESSVIFITWDEHGGYYDHVVPPVACDPDDVQRLHDEPKDFDFKHLGFRIPFFAVSPFARKGYVSHYTADHTSILRFIQAWKGLGALTRRDANAWPLYDMFDFATMRSDVELPDPSLDARSDRPENVGPCALADKGSSCWTEPECPQ